jgi:hypothetical protein
MIMKYGLFSFVIVVATFSVAFGQNKNAAKNNNASVEAQLIALQNQINDAWKNKNSDFYKSQIPDDAVLVSPTGPLSKSEVIGVVSSMPCKINGFSTDNYKVTMLSPDVAVLTFKVSVDADCNGQKASETAWATTMYMKRQGKWQAVFHQETPASK